MSARAATERDTPRSRRVARPHDPELSARPVDLGMLFLSAVFVLAGFAWPQAADALLRLLLATLGVGFIAVRAYRSIEPVVSTENQYSPFDDEIAVRPPASAPEALLELAMILRAADDGRSAQRRAIPPSTQHTIRQEASRRLTEHHGLKLGDPDDHPQIEALLSEPLWRLIRPAEKERRPRTRPAARSNAVPLSQLGRILDDLERL